MKTTNQPNCHLCGKPFQKDEWLTFIDTPYTQNKLVHDDCIDEYSKGKFPVYTRDHGIWDVTIRYDAEAKE